MKLEEQVLSIEQMQHLKSLGVDTTKASVVLIYKDMDGNEVDWEDVEFVDGDPFYIESDDEKWELYANYMDAENGDYDHSYRESCGVFTLQEILGKLPYGFEYFSLSFKDDCIGYYDSCGVCYKKFYFLNDSLDAAYNMLCWVAENGYLNE